MIGVRWRKVVRDLTHLRARTALVVLSIAIGVFAVGTIAGSQAALDASLRDGYERAQSANLIVYTTVPFDEGLHPDHKRAMIGHLVEQGHVLEHALDGSHVKLISGPMAPKPAD